MRWNLIEQVSQKETKKMDTQQLRQNFLLSKFFVDNEIVLYYLQYDRVVTGTAKPIDSALVLTINKQLATAFFLERRELGIVNIGGKGIVEHDKGQTLLEFQDGLYLPVGNQKIIFSSSDPANPAKFYLFSTIGYVAYPFVHVNFAKTQAVCLGEDACSNARVIHKYFHPDVCQTNSLLMGVTLLNPHNMWNTMPCHWHNNRFEAYLYFQIEPDEFVLHLMGNPCETRHLLVHNEEFVISPSWSIHSGVGTKNYAFIWAMAGENIDYTDMVLIAKKDLL